MMRSELLISRIMTGVQLEKPMKTMLSILALAGAATFMPLAAAEAAPIGSAAKIEHLSATVAEPVWWHRHRHWGGYGYYGYPVYGYYGCCYGGWHHHHRHWW